MLFTHIILHCMKQIKEERTIYGIYHLLTGKKSIQAVQDAHLYGLQDYYGIYKKLLKDDFDIQINKLIKNKYIVEKGKAIAVISSHGKSYLEETETIAQNHPFNGLIYTQIDQIFEKRLLLLIQVLTNRKMNNASFIPVIDEQEVMKWVKRYYALVREQESQALDCAYHELHSVLQELVNEDASLFVDRISAYGYYGFSTNQLASKYKLSAHNIKLRLVSIIHHILKAIDEKPKDFPFLYHIKNDLTTNGFITNSAKATYKLLDQHYTINEISNIRNLKTNTIYDHIVEISLYDIAFSIRPYVNETEERAIISAIDNTNSAKLKVIRDFVNDSISYFQIRLVLSRFHQMK